MRHLISLVCVCSAAVLVGGVLSAQEGGYVPMPWPGYLPMPWYSGSSIAVINPQPQFMTISCGSGSLSIAMKDGSATMTGDCNPDEVAMNFWVAVKRMAPSCP